MDFYNTLRNNILCGENQDNLMLSPICLHVLFSVIFQDPSYFHTPYYHKSVIESYNSDFISKQYEELLSFISSSSINTLLTISKLLFQQGHLLQDDFKALINKFHYEVEEKDFTKIEDTTKMIDTWVDGNIKNIVGHLLTSDSLKENTRLALLNAINFKELWDKPFCTSPNLKAFHLTETESTEVPFLEVTNDVYYVQNEYPHLRVIELECGSKELSVFCALPGNEIRLQDIVTSVVDLILNTSNSTAKQEVSISLPKFKLETHLDCRKLHPEFFLNKTSSLFGMLEGEEFLCVSHIDSNGFINFNEEGIEAANGITANVIPLKLDREVPSEGQLQIQKVNINTTVSNRFAKTLVTCNVQNNSTTARDANFNMVLPETAFITEFVMVIDGKQHKAFIKGKNEAKDIYQEALSSGKSAGLVETDVRNSSQFNVCINLEPQSVAVFLLTYEEMLERIHDQYEIVLNICPGQIVDDLNIQVNINESRPLKFVKTPPLRSGKEINKKIEKHLIPSSNIKMINTNAASVTFNADTVQQTKLCLYMGNQISEGFSGQLVVQYDVERDPRDGEILLQDGYFVHFFAPNDLDPIPKHVVFVLDTSTSMEGTKLIQLKDAMMSILSELRKDDLVSIIEFNQEAIAWDIKSEKSKVVSKDDFKNFEDPFGALSECSLPLPVFVSDEIISKAKNVVQNLQATGWTFMIGGLEMAIYMIKRGQKLIETNYKYQSIVVFLTDGCPNVGVQEPSEIIRLVTKLNLENHKVSIFTLSFGNDADKSFLRELSKKNFGFSRHIYEASDASLQLQSFYKQISSPLLSDIKFKYESDVKAVTRSRFPIYFKGCELVVSGQFKGCELTNSIEGCGPKGCLSLASIIKNPVTSLERFWAYLTVRQLLEERSTSKNYEELTEKAIDLALKYSFVTEVTSLIVFKPEAEHFPDNFSDLPSDEHYTCKKKAIKRRILRKKKVPAADDIDIINIECEENTPEEVKQRKKLEFLANRPFLIFLVLKKGDSRIILFMGSVCKPCS